MAYKARVDKTRKFGVEIEGYGVDRYDLQSMLMWLANSSVNILCENENKSIEDWWIETDATIKGECAFELSSPAMTWEDRSSLGSVLEVLQQRASYNESCGLHIHWDVSDFSGYDLVNLLKLYAKFESVIDLFVSKDRRNNVHCQSLIKQNGFDWLDDISDKPAFEISNWFKRTQKLENTTSFPTARHHKVNPLAINKHGTIEFRQHQATFSYQEILSWILLTQQMVNRAKYGAEIKPGEVSLGGFISILGLANKQLHAAAKGRMVYSLDTYILATLREFYKERYRKNKNGIKS